MSHHYLGHTYTKNIFILQLRFKFHWTSYTLPGNPASSLLEKEITLESMDKKRNLN